MRFAEQVSTSGDAKSGIFPTLCSERGGILHDESRRENQTEYVTDRLDFHNGSRRGYGCSQKTCELFQRILEMVHILFLQGALKRLPGPCLYLTDSRAGLGNQPVDT